MFSALTVSGSKIVSFEAHKDDGPFCCPECGDMLILRVGNIRVHHFAHKTANVECSMRLYSESESPQHRIAKFDIYRGLRKSNKFSMVEVEHRIGNSIADVYGEKDGVKIAIEIQHSEIDMREVAKRMIKYHASGVYCAWVSPLSAPEGSIRTKGWLRFIHAMNLGRVYHHVNESIVYAVHYGRYADYTPQQRCDERFYSQRRPVLRYDRPLDLANFVPVERPIHAYNGYLHIGLPDTCLIWHDDHNPWWLDSLRGWDEIMRDHKYHQFGFGASKRSV